VLTTEQVGDNLFTVSLDRLTEHTIKEEYASHLQVRYIKQYLFIGRTGVRAFCDRMDVLSSYFPFFPPVNGIRLTEMNNRDKHEVLVRCTTPRYIRITKEANQQPLRMNYTALREYSLNIETSAINPCILSDDNEDQGDSKPKGALDKVPKKNRGGGPHKYQQ
jgi:hypothetical protein